MTVSHIGTTLNNNGSVFLNSTTVTSIAAVAGDYILSVISWRDGSAETLSAPTWGGQTFTIIGSVINTTQGKIALYGLTAGSSTTSDVVASFSGFVFHNHSVTIMRDSVVGIFTPSSVSQNLYNSGTYSAPSLVKTSVPTGALLLSIFSAMGWDTGFSDVTATTWAGNKTLRGTITNAGVASGQKAVNILSIQSAAGAGSNITSTWAESANSPMYSHLVLYFEAAASTSFTFDEDPIQVGGGIFGCNTVGMDTIVSLTNAIIESTSADAFNFYMDDFEGGVAYVRLNEVVTLTASDGTISETATVTVNPPTGFTTVTMVDPLDTGVFALAQNAAVVDDAQITLPTSAGTLNPDSSLSGYAFGTHNGWIRDPSDGKMYTLTITISNSGLSPINLSASSIGIGIGIGL